jgi:hypothetical protein
MEMENGRKFIFKAEIPYNKITIEKCEKSSNKVSSIVCNGDKKVVEIRFLFKEVKFSE